MPVGIFAHQDAHSEVQGGLSAASQIPLQRYAVPLFITFLVHKAVLLFIVSKTRLPGLGVIICDKALGPDDKALHSVQLNSVFKKYSKQLTI